MDKKNVNAMHHYTDEEVIRGIMEGTHIEEITTFLYSIHRDKLINYLLFRRLVKYRQEAEDVVQEAFILLVRRIQKGGFVMPRASVKSYLYRIAINWAIDQIKDENQRKRVEDYFRSQEDPETEITLEEEAILVSIREDSAWNKFMKLGEKCKLLLRMVAEGFEYAEIQRVLGYETIGNVRIKKMRCLQKLAKL